MMDDYCKTCEHTEDECKDCYPELGYKNNKLKRDTEAVKEFVESPAFQQMMNALDNKEEEPKSAIAELLGVDEEEAKRQVNKAIDNARNNDGLSDEEISTMLTALDTDNMSGIGLTKEMMGVDDYSEDAKGIEWKINAPTALVEPISDDAIGIEFANGYAKGKADIQKKINVAIAELESERDKWATQSEGKYPMSQINHYQTAINIIRKYIGEQK